MFEDFSRSFSDLDWGGDGVLELLLELLIKVPSVVEYDAGGIGTGGEFDSDCCRGSLRSLGE